MPWNAEEQEERRIALAERRLWESDERALGAIDMVIPLVVCFVSILTPVTLLALGFWGFAAVMHW